jgi:hypothetical protein
MPTTLSLHRLDGHRFALPRLGDFLSAFGQALRFALAALAT